MKYRAAIPSFQVIFFPSVQSLPKYEIGTSYSLHRSFARLRVAERILGLRRHVSHLEKLLPICMHCKKIRDDTGQWVRVEDFVERETSRQLTHGICDQCYTIVARPGRS